MNELIRRLCLSQHHETQTNSKEPNKLVSEVLVLKMGPRWFQVKEMVILFRLTSYLRYGLGQLLSLISGEFWKVLSFQIHIPHLLQHELKHNKTQVQFPPHSAGVRDSRYNALTWPGSHTKQQTQQHSNARSLGSLRNVLIF